MRSFCGHNIQFVNSKPELKENIFLGLQLGARIISFARAAAQAGEVLSPDSSRLEHNSKNCS